MWNKKYTLVLIPNARGILKQFSIPVTAVYISVAVLFLFVIASFYFSAHFFTNKVTERELEKIRSENIKLSGKFEQMRWTLAEVETRYDKLIEKEILLRTVFDLPEIDLQERELGIGGPVSPTLATKSGTEKVAYETEVNLDYLLRLSRFELEKYNEVESSLHLMKDRLDHTPSIWTSKGWLSRGFGMKYDPFTGYKRMHNGIDIANHRGTPIIAAAAGKVISVRSAGGMGKMIIVDHGYGFKTKYGHLSKYKVKVGQFVKRGEIIALMGSTGYSTGPHLHYEVIRNGKSLNPMNFILNEM